MPRGRGAAHDRAAPGAADEADDAGRLRRVPRPQCDRRRRRQGPGRFRFTRPNVRVLGMPLRAPARGTQMNKRDFLKDAIFFFPAVGMLRALAADAEASATSTAGAAGTDPSAHWYGMGVDVDKCIGCNRCVEACKTENNVPEEPFYFRTWIERYSIYADGEVKVECI